MTEAAERSGGLGAAVRGASIPSLAGLAFELSGLAWVFGAAAALIVLGLLAGDPRLMTEALGSWLPVPEPQGAGALRVGVLRAGVLLALALPVVLVCARLGAGAARVAIAAGTGEDPPVSLGRAWSEGREVQVSAAGVWLQVFGMMASGTLVLIGPLVALTTFAGQDALGPFSGVLDGLALMLLLVYAAELAALHQLAIASLVRHDRGVGSAVLHGWRLMRAEPRQSRRLAALEFGARALVLAAAASASVVAGGPWGLAQLLLLGSLVGSARCRAWSIAYPRMGGLPATGEAAGL